MRAGRNRHGFCKQALRVSLRVEKPGGILFRWDLCAAMYSHMAPKWRPGIYEEAKWHANVPQMCSQQWCMCLMKTNRFDGPNQDYALINTTFSRFLANLCWITATFPSPRFLRLESRALKTVRMQDFRYSRSMLNLDRAGANV